MAARLLFTKETKCKNDRTCNLCGGPVYNGSMMKAFSYIFENPGSQSITRQFILGSCCLDSWNKYSVREIE